LGPTPSPDLFVTPTTNNSSSGTRKLDTRRRVLLLGGPNQYNPVVSCANHPSPTHDRYNYYCSAVDNPDKWKKERNKIGKDVVGRSTMISKPEMLVVISEKMNRPYKRLKNYLIYV
jgi:hypothetical protein